MNLTNYQGALKSIMLYTYPEVNLYMLNKNTLKFIRWIKPKTRQKNFINQQILYFKLFWIFSAFYLLGKNSIFYKWRICVFLYIGTMSKVSLSVFLIQTWESYLVAQFFHSNVMWNWPGCDWSFFTIIS